MAKRAKKKEPKSEIDRLFPIPLPKGVEPRLTFAVAGDLVSVSCLNSGRGASFSAKDNPDLLKYLEKQREKTNKDLAEDRKKRIADSDAKSKAAIEQPEE